MMPVVIPRARGLMKYNSTFHYPGEHNNRKYNLTADEWKAKAEALWALLDDIDTAGDMFKPETTPFFRYVIGKAEERSKYMESDAAAT